LSVRCRTRPRDTHPTGRWSDLSEGLQPCPLILDAAHNRTANDSTPIVIVHGRRFMVRVDSLYRGERTIAAVLGCLNESW
jgi:hypothetical protein